MTRGSDDTLAAKRLNSEDDEIRLGSLPGDQRMISCRLLKGSRAPKLVSNIYTLSSRYEVGPRAVKYETGL